MARTLIAVQTFPGERAQASGAAAALTALGATEEADGIEWQATGKDVLIILNGAGGPTSGTAVVVSRPSRDLSRTENEILDVPADGVPFHCGPYSTNGWANSEGRIQVNFNTGVTGNTSVYVVRLE